MNKPESNMKAYDYLQQSAEQLAKKHQQRLHQMTRVAVFGERKKQTFHFDLFTKVASVTFALLLMVVVWQVKPLQDASLSIDKHALNSDIPQWVQDTNVPVVVLENIEFYQWLEKELEGKNNNA